MFLNILIHLAHVNNKISINDVDYVDVFKGKFETKHYLNTDNEKMLIVETMTVLTFIV